MFDLQKSEINQHYRYKEGGSIYDIIAMDKGTHYLLAASRGIMLITAEGQFINRYFKGQNSSCLCHISGPLYLVGFENLNLQVWNVELD